MAWWLGGLIESSEAFRGGVFMRWSVPVIVSMALEDIECSEHRESKDKDARSR